MVNSKHISFVGFKIRVVKGMNRGGKSDLHLVMDKSSQPQKYVDNNMLDTKML